VLDLRSRTTEYLSAAGRLRWRTTSARPRVYRSGGSRSGLAARRRRSRPTSTTRRARRRARSRRATSGCAGAAAPTASRATARETRTRSARPAFPARSGCAIPARTCWQRCARRTGNWLVDPHFRNANPSATADFDAGPLLQVVPRGIAIGRAAGRPQPAAGYAEHTTRGSPGGRDRTADATSATVAKHKPVSTVSGEQSDRQPSAGASQPDAQRLASSTDADSAQSENSHLVQDARESCRAGLVPRLLSVTISHVGAAAVVAE
jgi:hypothetical protein